MPEQMTVIESSAQGKRILRGALPLRIRPEGSIIAGAGDRPEDGRESTVKMRDFSPEALKSLGF
jgi:hypothetical protein